MIAKVDSEALDNGRSAGFETINGRPTTNRATDGKIVGPLSTSNCWIGSGETNVELDLVNENDAHASLAGTSLGKVDKTNF